MATRARRLRVGEREYVYRVVHEHGARSANALVEGCRDILTLRSDIPRSAALRLVFEPGPGRVVGDGFNPTGMLLGWYDDIMRDVPPGTALVTREPPRALNLHEPGVARGFLDEALARGWDGVVAGEQDGWALFDAVHERLQRVRSLYRDARQASTARLARRSLGSTRWGEGAALLLERRHTRPRRSRRPPKRTVRGPFRSRRSMPGAERTRF